MKTLLTLIIILCLSTTLLFAGSDESMYDKRWTITVIDCQGHVTVYQNCALTNQGEWTASFIPNSSRVGTPRGSEVIIQRNTCSQITMQEVL